MSAVIGALRGVLSMDSAAFETGAKRAKATMGSVERRMLRLGTNMEKAGRRMALGLTLPMAGAAAVAVKSSLKIVDAQAKMAQSLGTTVKSMQVLERAADLSGVSIGEVQQATIQLTKRLSQAAGGSGAAAKALKRLHLTAADLQKLPLDERLAKIQGAIAEYVPAAERAAVASDLFGSRAGLIFTRIDGAALRTAAEDVSRFGVAVSEVDADRLELANDAMSRLGLAGRGLANQLTVALVPAMQGLADNVASIAEWFASLDAGSQRLAAGLAAAGAAIGPVTLGLGLFLKAASPVVKGMFAITTAARALSAAMWAAAGPWGMLAGLVVAAGAAYAVFGKKTRTFQDTMDELDAAQETLNTQVAAFATTYAPAAGKAAIDAANDYLEAAKAAREFAAAQLASDTAEANRIQRMIDNGHLRTLTMEEQAKMSARLHGAQSRLTVSQKAYDRALRARDETVKKVMSSDAEMAETTRKLNSEIEISVGGVKGLGGGMKEAAKDAGDLAAELDGPLSSAVDGVARSFGDWVANGFRDFENMWDSMKQAAKRGLADLATTFAQNKLKVFLGISASGTGSAASAAGSAVGGGGSGGGLLGGLAGNAAGSLFGAGTFLGGIGAGAQAALGMGGYASAGLFSVGANAAVASAATGASAFAATLGAALPVIGTVLAVGALFKKAFSRKYSHSGIEGTFSAGDFEGSAFDFYKGGWLRSDKTRRRALDAELEAALDAQIGAVTGGIENMAASVGLATDALAGFEGVSFKITTSGKSQEEIQEALQEKMQEAADGMAGLVLGTEEFSRTGESASGTLSRLSVSLTAANDAMDLLGHNLFGVSLAGGDAASALIDVFGGAEAMATAANTYFAGFYSGAERNEIVLRRLGEQFEELGAAMPQSRLAFRELVEGIDTTTQTGRQLYAGLLQLSGAMNEVLPEVAQFSIAVAGLVEEIGGEIGLQIGTARGLAADAKAAASLWYKTAGTLRDFVGDLVNSDLTGASKAQALEVQRGRFQTAFAAAKAGDADAAAQIPGLAKAYLQSVQANAGSALEFRRIAAEVQGQVKAAAGIAELEGANQDVLRGLYEQQIDVLTNLGNFLQLEGLTGEQVSELSGEVQALAEDWDGTVAAFEASLGALEEAVRTAEAFSYDDLVGALDVAVTLDENAPDWLRELVDKADSGIRTTLDFIIRRDDLTAADRWIATTALSEHVASLDFILRTDLDGQTRRLVLETGAELRRDLHLKLGQDLDADTRSMVLTRAADLSRRVNVALTGQGRKTVAQLTELRDMVGSGGSGKITFDGGLSFAPDSAFATLFADVAKGTRNLVSPLNALRGMLGQLRAAVEADRVAREQEAGRQRQIAELAAAAAKEQSRITANQKWAANLVAKVGNLEERTGTRLRLGTGDAILSLNPDGTIAYSADGATGGNVKAFGAEFWGKGGLQDYMNRANSNLSLSFGRLEALRAQVAALGGVPAFALGGAHAGGWRMVGERGWELEHTGPSRVISHSDSVAMLDNRQVVSSLDAMAKQVGLQGQRMELFVRKIAQFLEDWDEAGQPEVRA